jgi:hypothetical protein
MSGILLTAKARGREEIRADIFDHEAKHKTFASSRLHD